MKKIPFIFIVCALIFAACGEIDGSDIKNAQGDGGRRLNQGVYGAHIFFVTQAVRKLNSFPRLKYSCDFQKLFL